MPLLKAQHHFDGPTLIHLLSPSLTHGKFHDYFFCFKGKEGWVSLNTICIPLTTPKNRNWILVEFTSALQPIRPRP